MKQNFFTRRIAFVLVAIIMPVVMTGCAQSPFRDWNLPDNKGTGESGSQSVTESVNTQSQGNAVNEDKDKKTNDGQVKEEKTDKVDILSHEFLSGKEGLQGRTIMLSNMIKYSGESFVPTVASYQVKKDGSNLEVNNRFHLQDQMMEKLIQNNFVVVDGSYCEFFNLYEDNRYQQVPSFVTVDSMMHTYHLYFAMLQKNTELEYLVDCVNQMSMQMFETSVNQYQILKGTEWEEAAWINEAFFAVGVLLSGQEITVPDEIKDVVAEEAANVYAAEGIILSNLNQEAEDYSQYKPRGYYEGNEILEQYFRTMMWYGRRNFKQNNEKMDRCALLMSIALDGEALLNWERVYSVTAFFAGASDDSGVYEYLPLIRQAYGDKMTLADLPGNTEAFQTYHRLTAELEPPKINSVALPDDGGATVKTEVAKGYRFMGQRFSVDAAIFTKLCYSSVMPKANDERRMLPDALDVPAALGSDCALNLLKDAGNYEFSGYEEKMAEVRKEYGEAPDSLWSASLYGGWMNMLRPLLTVKKEGYPSFMQSEEWNKKNLEGFLSSYTELKHDTVLYSKQFMAEMGGGDEEKTDDRGYVEPEPEVYRRLSELSMCTSEGLQKFGVISKESIENLARLSELALRLEEISVKELTGETITEEDYELIRSFGGNLEHFWADTIRPVSGNEYNDSREYPAALVVDIATDPNGDVLEQAIGGISAIYVVVPIDGKLRVAKGGVFTYYQFTQPIESRLTDSEWRVMIGMELNEEGNYEPVEDLKQPDWTQSYRTQWIYNYD